MLLIVSPQILLFGTISLWLSKVLIVVDTKLMWLTRPVTPPALIKSPTSNGRYTKIIMPEAKFDKVSCKAKPMITPAIPKPASSGASSKPS